VRCHGAMVWISDFRKVGAKSNYWLDGLVWSILTWSVATHALHVVGTLSTSSLKDAELAAETNAARPSHAESNGII
jgi:hypothetical protein